MENLAKAQQTASTQATEQYTHPTRAELLKLVNEERAKYGVAALVEDSMLDQSAQ